MMRQCSEVQDNLAAFVDGALDEEAHALIESHVAACAICRDEAAFQAGIKKQLASLKRKQSREPVPGRVWAEARKEWDVRDGRRLRRFQTQFALATAGVMLTLFGLVWANRATEDIFPSESVISDFQAIRAGHHKFAFVTGDADRAMKWLRIKLHNDQLPPIDLSLSNSELIGVDVVKSAAHPFGRLIYQTPQGLAGLYIMPNASRFIDLEAAKLEGETFKVDLRHKGIGFYGWSAGGAGYALTVSPPIQSNTGLLLDAERESLQPLH